MTDHTFKHHIVAPDETVDIPDDARDVNIQHEITDDGVRLHISWLEKQSESVI